MKKIKKILELIKYNIWTLVGFESMYKLITLLIFSPLFLNCFKLITRITGYSYLTLENVFSFLINPITIIMLLILILFMMVYTIFDIATIIVILDFSYQKKKIKIMDAINISLKKCQNIVHLKNISLAFFVLFLIPFLHMGVSTSFITTIKIPEFIMEYILNNKFLFIILFILVISLIIILLRWIYSIHYFILEDIPFKEARKKSIILSKDNKIKDLLTLFLVSIITTFIYLIFIFISILLIILVSKMFNKILIIKSLTTSIIWFLIAFSFIVYTLLSTPISYACISIMYYFHKTNKKEKIINISIKNKTDKKTTKHLKTIFIILGIVAVILGTIFIYGLYKGKYNFNIEYTRTLEVTAHRGASKNYPENTMLAFIKAKELKADWIELDVQQTHDGKIIVIHDTNFKRTTGIDKNTWELDYQEVEKLDAGSFLDKKYQGEKIPLLEDVIKFAKQNNIKLNIELKPTGHEKDFEKNVVDIITDLDFNDRCVITSQVYDVLKKVKKYNPNIETVYVMSLAYGSITDLKEADHFSIEAASVNKPLVKRVHNSGKKLYVWTVNSTDSINKMIDYNVDNIITDNITKAKEMIYESKTSNIIKEYIKIIENIF